MVNKTVTDNFVSVFFLSSTSWEKKNVVIGMLIVGLERHKDSNGVVSFI